MVLVSKIFYLVMFIVFSLLLRVDKLVKWLFDLDFSQVFSDGKKRAVG